MIVLRQHQVDAIKFIQDSKHLGVLLQHGLGLGKTLTSLMYARTKMARLKHAGVASPKFLVVIPKSASVTWISECQKHTNDIYRDMVLIPYSQLNKAPKLIMYYDIRLIILDESHYIRTMDTNRARDLSAMLISLATSKGQFKYGQAIMLSGTPMLNSAAELYTTWAVLASPDASEASRRIVDKIRYEKWTKSFAMEKEKKWKTRHGEKKGSVYEGVANPEMLKELLAPIVHFRRVEDCIDLPDKQETSINLHIPDDKLLKDADIEKPEAYIAVLERLARAKTPYLLEWVKDFLATTTEQIVVFAPYKFPVKELAERFPKDTVLVTGEETGAERTANIEAFQSGKKRVIALTFGAGSESLNLQNAHSAIYLSFPWTFGKLKQAMGRIHRSGQTKFTNHYFLVSGDNDDRILDIVRKKQDMTTIIENHMASINNVGTENKILTLDELL